MDGRGLAFPCDAAGRVNLDALPENGRNNYLLNELGIAIFYPNVRGSTGYGKTFVKLDNGYQREDSYKDIDTLLDWIKAQPNPVNYGPSFILEAVGGDRLPPKVPSGPDPTGVVSLLSNGDCLFAHASTKLSHIVRQAPFAQAHLKDQDLTVDFSDVTSPDDRACIAKVRELLSFLPLNNTEDPPVVPTRDPADESVVEAIARMAGNVYTMMAASRVTCTAMSSLMSSTVVGSSPQEPPSTTMSTARSSRSRHSAGSPTGRSEPGNCSVHEISGSPSVSSNSCAITCSGTRMPTVLRRSWAIRRGSSLVACSTKVYGPGVSVLSVRNWRLSTRA